MRSLPRYSEIALARPATSPSGTSMPVSPFTTASTVPVAAKPTTGILAAAASSGLNRQGTKRGGLDVQPDAQPENEHVRKYQRQEEEDEAENQEEENNTTNVQTNNQRRLKFSFLILNIYLIFDSDY